MRNARPRHRHGRKLGHNSRTPSLQVAISSQSPAAEKMATRVVLRRILVDNALRRCPHRLGKLARALRAMPDDETRELDRVDELVERSLVSWQNESSKFLSPLVWTTAIEKAKAMADVRMVAIGGHPNAERRIVVCGREESMFGVEESSTNGICAMQVKGNFLFDRASHPDFLGAVLGTGIERWNIGDILVSGEEGATIICLESIAEHLSTSLVQVRSVPVTTRQISWDQVVVPEQRLKEVKSVEASLRIDAIVSAGFGCSRSKASDAIKDGAVKLNWQVCKKPSTIVGEGATLSWKGRVTVESVALTAKNRYAVTLKRTY